MAEHVKPKTAENDLRNGHWYCMSILLNKKPSTKFISKTSLFFFILILKVSYQFLNFICTFSAMDIASVQCSERALWALQAFSVQREHCGHCKRSVFRESTVDIASVQCSERALWTLQAFSVQKEHCGHCKRSVFRKSTVGIASVQCSERALWTLQAFSVQKEHCGHCKFRRKPAYEPFAISLTQFMRAWLLNSRLFAVIHIFINSKSSVGILCLGCWFVSMLVFIRTTLR